MKYSLIILLCAISIGIDLYSSDSSDSKVGYNKLSTVPAPTVQKVSGTSIRLQPNNSARAAMIRQLNQQNNINPSKNPYSSSESDDDSESPNCCCVIL